MALVVIAELICSLERLSMVQQSGSANIFRTE
jgi:hypothetical protein